MKPQERINRLEHLLRFAKGWEKYKQYLVEPITDMDMGVWRCGTTACLGGSAAMHPWFIERGLCFREGLIVARESRRTFPWFDHNIYSLAVFFGITTLEARSIFTSPVTLRGAINALKVVLNAYKAATP